jgi:putative transposase
MSLRDASQFLETVGVQRSHVAFHDWVHKAELQPLLTMTTDQFMVGEKMIRPRGHVPPEDVHKTGKTRTARRLAAV